MKPPDEARLALVQQWIAKADVDYRTAERLLRDAEPIRKAVALAFHEAFVGRRGLRVFTVPACFR